jgi:hypothetical protein
VVIKDAHFGGGKTAADEAEQVYVVCVQICVLTLKIIDHPVVFGVHYLAEIIQRPVAQSVDVHGFVELFYERIRQRPIAVRYVHEFPDGLDPLFEGVFELYLNTALLVEFLQQGVAIDLCICFQLLHERDRF